MMLVGSLVQPAKKKTTPKKVLLCILKNKENTEEAARTFCNHVTSVFTQARDFNDI